MYTLNTSERHAVAFSEVHGTLSANDDPKGPSSQMLSNPKENFVAEPAYGLDRASFNQGRNAKYDFSVTEESEPTMTARGPNAVAQPVYTTSKGKRLQRSADRYRRAVLHCTQTYSDGMCKVAGIPGLVVFKSRNGKSI